MPDIGEVPGQTARNQKDCVDANVVARAREAGRKLLGRMCDPAQPIMIERQRRAFLASTRLDLDEGKNSSATGDKIDFTTRHAGTPSENPPTVEAKPPGGQPLGSAAALLGNRAPVQRESSRARA